jgi:hypothetical protein
MAPDQESGDRDAALRAMLVERVSRPAETHTARLAPGRLRPALVTAVVLVVIVVLSVVAVRFGADRSAPARGGQPTSSAIERRPAPQLTVPAGKVLGRYSSADGPNQTHVIHPDGLAIATAYVCTGKGSYFFGVAHDGDQSGSPSCNGGGGGSGNKGIAGDTTVKIRTAKGMRWTFVVVGIPETYVTPRPIPTPTDTSGTAVRYCTADDLTARFLPRKMPAGVTEVSGGDLAFTNRGSTTCALAGYPEVRFLDGEKPLGHNTMNHTDERMTEEHGLRAVILRPGGLAYSQIDWYLANYYPENEEGTCDALPVTRVQVDLHYDLASPGQTGTVDVPIGKATACLNGAHGALGKYGQLSSTVFVDYPNIGKR